MLRSFRPELPSTVHGRSPTMRNVDSAAGVLQTGTEQDCDVSTEWGPIGGVTVDGVPVTLYSTVQWPRTSPVVFAHGLEDSWESWIPVAERVQASGHDIVALELPWRTAGGFQWPARGGIERWIREGLAVLPTSATAIVAHSLAGGAVLRMLRAGSLAPAATAAVLITPMVMFASTQDEGTQFGAFTEQVGVALSQLLRARLGHRATHLDSDVLETMVRALQRRIGGATLRNVYSYILATQSLSSTPDSTRVLVLSTPEEPATRHGWIARIDSLVPNAAVRILPEGSHACHLEHPVAVADAITKFLSPST